ncbi:MAG: hypothetical protein IKU40_06055 [Clostridia bacterium]|nr:hypothetical protein [Clostridia bacterium]
MKHYSRKLMAALLAAILLAGSLLTACSEGTDNTEKTDTSASVSADAGTAAEEIVPEETEEEYPLGLPEGLDYQGTGVTVLGWQHYEDVEFDTEELNGEIVNDAIFARNLAVEENLNVTLTFLEEGGRSGDSNWMGLVRNSNTSGDGAYDFVAGHSNNIGSLTYSLQFQNMLDQEHFDFSAPWWREALTEKATVMGNLFFATGDIAPSSIGRSQGIFFNSKLLADYNLEDPYELVISGDWTFDKFYEMCSGTYVDLNSNGKKDEKADQFGFVIDGVQVQAIGLCSGFVSLEADETGKLGVSENYISERAVNLVDRWASLMHNSPDTSFIAAIDDTTVFKEGRSVFYAFPMAIISSELRDLEFEIGFVPFPKIDEQQEDYVVCTSNAYSLWSIPLAAKDPAMSAAIMENMAYEGFLNVIPAIFETSYKVKYNTTDSQLQSQVFDIVRGSLIFDIGRIMNSSFANVFGLIPDAINSNSGTFASAVARQQKAINKTVERWISSLEG